MAISQPITTDKLNSPDHSLMHRQIATDPSAAVKSMCVDSAGNVGIGIETPATKLDVNGTLKVSSTTTLNGQAYTWPSSLTNGYFLQTNGSGTLSWVNAYNPSSDFIPATGGAYTLGTQTYVWKKLDLYRSGGTGLGGTDSTGGLKVGWNSGYGVSLDAWDSGFPRWGIYKFNANNALPIVQGTYDSQNAYFAGKVSVGGLNAATAYLHLPACTAAANTASLKIDPGTVADAAVSGNIESDGTHLYWTDSGGNRRQLDN
jgi:hypothetical protein